PLVNYIGSGLPSPKGLGFASYYLDDVATDGMPDFNPAWGAAFVNAGDPLWFETLDSERSDIDGQFGMEQLLTTGKGRSGSAEGLGADGLFLDTIDTCAPNSWTGAGSSVQSDFEWTAPGFSDFIRRLRGKYPDAILVQNRGLFFLNKDCAQFAFTTRPWIDFLLFESYRLDSTIEVSPYFGDNRFNYLPKLSAEASRADGFQILSLEYYRDDAAVPKIVDAATRVEALRESISVAGFRSYLADRDLAEANTLALDRAKMLDNEPPVWSSTLSAYGAGQGLLGLQSPRVGVRRVLATDAVGATEAGSVYISWDVAIDENPVDYVAYYSYGDGSLSAMAEDLPAATRIELGPITTMGRGYAAAVCADPASGPFPFEAKIRGLTSGRTVEITVRARDRSPLANEEANRVVLGLVVP
ncbi:MAG: hypothetical protein WCL50_09695, partial [Spirochaetota bacterium]